MPEGDTIHTIAAALRPRLEGRRVVRVEIDRFEKDWLAGALVRGVEARGKHLLIVLRPKDYRERPSSAECVVRSHLGLHGSWHRYARGEPWQRPAWQCSLRVDTDADVLVCFNAMEVAVISSSSGSRDRALARLGPDLLGERFDWKPILERARKAPSATPIADLLLDQTVASGIGNVYKSEVCFMEGLRPQRAVGAHDDETLERIYRRARQLLQANVGSRARRTTDATPESNLWVYGRAGLPCLRCATPVRFARMARSRSTYWCPSCQRG